MCRQCSQMWTWGTEEPADFREKETTATHLPILENELKRYA